jgi:hypothetical protein
LWIRHVGSLRGANVGLCEESIEEVSPMNREEDRELGLAELLESLGEELRTANGRAGAKGVATLAWAEATVEVELEVKTTAKGEIKFAVLGIGAGAGADRGTGRTVRAQVRCVPAGEVVARSDIVGKPVEVRGVVVGADIR